MIDGVVKREDLQRMLYNAALFSNKSSAVKGNVLFIPFRNNLVVISTDEYVVVKDETPWVSAPQEDRLKTWVTTQSALKELERTLESSDSHNIHLKELTFDLDIEPNSFDLLNQAEEALSFCQKQHDTFQYDPPPDNFSVHPERLKKLSLIKPRKYPIDFKFFRQESEFLGFRIGPTVSGIIATLDREFLKEKYTGKELWI